MSFLETTSLLISSFILITILGIGPVLTFLPSSVRRYSLFVAPATGYVLFCFFSIWGSGLLNASVLHSNWWTFSSLLLWAVIASIFRRHELSEIARSAKWMPVLFGLMLIIVFFPALQQGADLYLGTVNPDFYQSLSFHESLMRFNAPFWVSHWNLPLHGPFLEMFPDALQARFGGVVFSVFVDQLIYVPPRAALIISIMTFLGCLPLVIYFFCRTVLEFKHKTSVLAAILIIISAPITMSFIHTFIGQNSALATLPLSISFAYLTLREKSVLLALLTALILNGMFWLYVMALPYVVVPVGLFALLRCLRSYGWKNVKWLGIALLCVVAVTVVVHGTILNLSIHFMKDLFDLLSKVTQSIYYLDFLNEAVLQYATGLTSYPLSQSMLMFFNLNNTVEFLLLILGALLSFICLASVYFWAKTVSREAVTLVLSLIVTYIAVWAYYTFINRYGYASFKMVSWLQFIAVPFFAWGIIFCIEKLHDKGLEKNKRIVAYGSLIALIPIYLGLNLVSDLDYVMKSYGNDPSRGTLINSFGVSNNNDFPSLSTVLKKKIPAGSTVAAGLSDQIQNTWAAYYIDKAGDHARILSHEEIPFEDSYLPDIASRQYIDSFGNSQKDQQRFFFAGEADFYLMPGQGNLNKEIINNTFYSKPIWSNRTFSLYKKQDINDLIITGRGFHRIEHMDQKNHNWWWPETFRWTAQGGELYHLFPSSPDKAYRIRLSAIAGLGLKEGRRTLEFWLNDKKFDEVIVNGSARITSRAYYPIDGVNRLVIRISEKSELPPGHFGLWNRDLPKRSRQINLLVSNIEIIKNKVNHPEWKLDEVVEAKSMFDLLEEFNGFDVDGWIRDRAEFSLVFPKMANVIHLNFLAPGNLGFAFPYYVQISLNGVPHKVAFSKPGEHELLLNLPQTTNRSKLHVEIIPSEAKHLADGIEQREVLQSIRLTSMEFSSK